MAKVTIPAASAQNGGNLYILVDDLTNLNSEVTRTRDNDNLILDDANASAAQKIQMDEATILSVLAESGDSEGYLFAVRVPISVSNTAVPVGVPLRTNIVGDVKVFKDWFLPDSEVWLKDDNSELIFYTDPNPPANVLLKASEAELIRQIDTVNYSFLTTEEASTEVASGWTKFIWN